MRRSGLMGKLCALAALFGLMLHASACAMTICWVADGRYEFSKAVPRMYFFNTETQQVDVREIPFENVRLVEGEYSGMPIVAAYDPNAETDLYACPCEASSADALPFIHFAEIDLADGELLAYSNDLMYVVEDSDSASYFPNALDIAAIDSGNKTNIVHAPDGFYDALHLLRLNLRADGLSELNELLQFDYRGQRGAVNYVSPLALCFADKD